jgi:hypothetical protein
MAVRLLALRAGRPLPQEDSWYSFLVETESDENIENVKLVVWSNGRVTVGMIAE